MPGYLDLQSQYFLQRLYTFSIFCFSPYRSCILFGYFISYLIKYLKKVLQSGSLPTPHLTKYLKKVLRNGSLPIPHLSDLFGLSSSQITEKGFNSRTQDKQLSCSSRQIQKRGETSAGGLTSFLYLSGCRESNPVYANPNRVYYRYTTSRSDLLRPYVRL